MEPCPHEGDPEQVVVLSWNLILNLNPRDWLEAAGWGQGTRLGLGVRARSVGVGAGTGAGLLKK